MPAIRSAQRRAITTAVLLALVGVGVGVGVAASPASAADRISFSNTSYEGGPVLAADGRVVIGERLASGARRILAFQPATHVFDEIARFAAPADAREFHVLKLAGSGGTVTATLDTLRDVGDSTAEQAQPALRSSRAFTVLPALTPLATCDRVDAAWPSPIEASAGDGFVALTADDCGPASSVHLRSAGGTRTIAAEGAGPVPPELRDLRAAGPFATWTETRFDVGAPKASFVAARGSTGEVLLRSGPIGRHGLGSDGTLVIADPGGCALSVVTLAPLAQRRAGLAAGLCPGLFGQIAVAGGRAVYPVLGSYAVSDLRGAAHVVADLRVAGASAPIAFDGRVLYGVQPRCVDELLLAVDTTLPGGAPAPFAPPPSTRTCPVRRAGSGRVRVSPSGRAGIRLRCPSGCRGTLRLVQQRRGGRERLIGSADFAASTGQSFVLRPRIARWARAAAGCKDGLRAVAQVHRPNDGTSGIGAYRILSRSSCRRSGGPAFAAPRAWPREW